MEADCLKRVIIQYSNEGLNATVQLGGSDFRLSWPTSGPPYVLECATNLITPVWQPVTNGLGQSGGQNSVTNPGSGSLRFFRLHFIY